MIAIINKREKTKQDLQVHLGEAMLHLGKAVHLGGAVRLGEVVCLGEAHLHLSESEILKLRPQVFLDEHSFPLAKGCRVENINGQSWPFSPEIF